MKILLAHALWVATIAAIAAVSFGAQQSKVDAKGDWKRYSLSDARLSVELPDDPSRFAGASRDQSRQKAEVAQGPRLSVGGVILRFSCAEYQEGSTVDLERAAQGAVASITGTRGVTEFKFSRTDLKVSGVPAIRLETSYEFSGQRRVGFWILIVGEGEHLWQASAMFAASDPNQADIAKRILGSVRVEKR